MLGDHVQATLDKLGFKYRKNTARYVIEFEVVSPCSMLIRVEDLARERAGFPYVLRSSLKVESAIELRRVIGATTPEEEVRRNASIFARSLRDVLPKEPWKGIGLIGSRSEKSNWEKLEEL